MSSIIDYFIYLSVFQRRCWDEHQVRCPQCIPSIREQKKKSISPLLYNHQFSFQVPGDGFYNYSLYLSRTAPPSPKRQRPEKKNPQTAKNAVKPLYTKETQLTCNAGEFGGRTKPDCLSQNNVLSAIFDFSMEIRNPHLTRPKAPIFLAFNVSVTQAETFAKKKPANQV